MSQTFLGQLAWITSASVTGSASAADSDSFHLIGKLFPASAWNLGGRICACLAVVDEMFNPNAIGMGAFARYQLGSRMRPRRWRRG